MAFSPFIAVCYAAESIIDTTFFASICMTDSEFNKLINNCDRVRKKTHSASF